MREAAPSESVKRMLPWLVAVAFFMESLDTTILNTALPAMAAALHVVPLSMKSVLRRRPTGGRKHGEHQQMSMSFGVAAASLTTAVFIPDRFRSSPAEMIHGIHLARVRPSRGTDGDLRPCFRRAAIGKTAIA